MKNHKNRLRLFAKSEAYEADDTAAFESVAEQITIQRIDEARAVVRPTNVGDTWVEQEYDALRTEQVSLWDASGRRAALQPEAEAFGLRLASDAAEKVVGTHTPVLEAAARRHADTVEALSPFRRRSPSAKPLHYAAKAALLLGDMVGVTVMGISIGDYPILAFLMSIAAATAAVIAGLVGADIRDAQMARRRRRDPSDLTALQQPFQHLFTGTGGELTIVKLLWCTSAVVMLTIAAGIFAGRGELEGLLTGLIYGGIAAAVATASFIESYIYADEVVDHIEAASRAYDKEVARHTRLAGSRVWRERHEKIAQTESIVSEHSSRGEAAAHHVRALKWGILRRNPNVVGHGRATQAGSPVGLGSRR